MENSQLNLFAASGMAAIIPGFQYALDQLQKMLDDIRLQLAAMQGGVTPKRGRPAGSTGRNGWSDDPVERRAEMKRRMAKRQPHLHPRDKNHPEHAAWVEKMRQVQKKRFEGMSFKERKEWKAKMQQGRRPTVKMEAA